RYVLGRMALADDDAPGLVVDGDDVAAPQALEIQRQIDAVLVWQHVLDELLHAALVETVTAIERRARLDRVGDAVHAREIGGQPFRLAHQRPQVPSRGDPAGIAGMIGMEMRHDQPRHRTIAEHVRPDILDQLAYGGTAIAAVDHGPAVAVAQKPEVDLLQADERHRRGDPEEARRGPRRRSRGPVNPE